MKLTPSTPVTIQHTFDGERWFPTIRKLRDGSLLLHVQIGHDLAFSAVRRWRSFDNGKQWVMEDSNVPRCPFCWQFSDGQLLEMDNYGGYDLKTPSDSVSLAALSWPESRADQAQPIHSRMVDSPNFKTPCLQWVNGNPTMPWWPLWESLIGEKPFHNDLFTKVHLNGYFFCDGIEISPDRLVAVAYGMHGGTPLKHNITYTLETLDRGRTWRRLGTITDLTPGQPGTNEAGITRLKDGRLYSILRTDIPTLPHPMVHSWSSDNGKTWTRPEIIRLIDEPDHQPALTWPRVITLSSGALVCAYGRPGKHLIIDPTGTGTQWQGRVDLHENELRTQAFNGVPEDKRLRGVVGHMTDLFLDRYHDSSDYLAITQTGPDELRVFYDVQDYLESWNARPYSGVRMVNVKIQA